VAANLDSEIGSPSGHDTRICMYTETKYHRLKFSFYNKCMKILKGKIKYKKPKNV